MNSLQGKNALITGGASGIGKAITEELSRLGVNAIIHYYSSYEAAVSLQDKITQDGKSAHIFRADLTNQEEVKKLINFTKDKFGSLDILVNNTGDMVQIVDFIDIDMEYFHKVMAVNLDSMILVTREALPLLKLAKEASVINMSSLAGRKGGRGGSLSYSTSKGAVITYTRALALELACYGIRVNCVAPGLILGTKFHDTYTSKKAQHEAIRSIPLERAGTPEDVARAVCFLASEYNGFITGATLGINGGVYTA